MSFSLLFYDPLSNDFELKRQKERTCWGVGKFVPPLPFLLLLSLLLLIIIFLSRSEPGSEPMALRRLFASWAATAFVWACFIDAAEGDRCGAGTLNLGEPIVTVSFIGNTTNTTTTTTYGEPEESYLWVAGAFTSIVGSVCSNLGVNVQKYSFNKEEKKPLNKRRKYIKMPGYWIGIALVIIGALGDFVALGMAAQSIVAPIGAITLVRHLK